MSEMQAVVTIDARVSGYGDKPTRVMAVCIPSTGRILIKKIAPYAEPAERKNDTVLVTDSPSHFNSWQLVFKEKEHLEEAIKTYFDSLHGKRIKLESEINKYDPASILQTKKVDKGGIVKEFDSSQIENGHMAVLLAVWASAKASMGYVIANESDSVEDGDDDPMMPFSL